MQTFDDPDLRPVGKYLAEPAAFGEATEIDSRMICRWLNMANSAVFDSMVYFKKFREMK